MDDEVVKSITGSGEISYGVWSNHVHGQTELCNGQIDYRQQSNQLWSHVVVELIVLLNFRLIFF